MECENNVFVPWAIPEVCQLGNRSHILQMESDLVDEVPDQYSGRCNMEVNFNYPAINLIEQISEVGHAAGLHSDHYDSVYTNSLFKSTSPCYKMLEVQANYSDTLQYLGKRNLKEESISDQIPVLLAVKEGMGNCDRKKATHSNNMRSLCRPMCQNPYINRILGCEDSGHLSETVEDGDMSASEDDGDDGFGSDYSCSDTDSESENAELLELWNSFNNYTDPYNPYNFTAQIYSGQTADSEETEEEFLEDNGEHLICSESLSGSVPVSSDGESDEEFEESCFDYEESCFDYAESLELWNSFASCNDPYNPLNFRAQFQPVGSKKDADAVSKEKSTTELPSPQPYATSSHDDYERFDSGFSETTDVLLGIFINTPTTQSKKVTFSDDITEYYINSQEDRKGPWEEFARDRCRFQKRVKEVEYSISYCFTPEHRWRALQRLLTDVGLQTCHSVVILHEDESCID